MIRCSFHSRGALMREVTAKSTTSICPTFHLQSELIRFPKCAFIQFSSQTKDGDPTTNSAATPASDATATKTTSSVQKPKVIRAVNTPLKFETWKGQQQQQQQMPIMPHKADENESVLPRSTTPQSIPSMETVNNYQEDEGLVMVVVSETETVMTNSAATKVDVARNTNDGEAANATAAAAAAPDFRTNSYSDARNTNDGEAANASAAAFAPDSRPHTYPDDYNNNNVKETIKHQKVNTENSPSRFNRLNETNVLEKVHHTKLPILPPYQEVRRYEEVGQPIDLPPGFGDPRKSNNITSRNNIRNLQFNQNSYPRARSSPKQVPVRSSPKQDPVRSSPKQVNGDVKSVLRVVENQAESEPGFTSYPVDDDVDEPTQRPAMSILPPFTASSAGRISDDVERYSGSRGGGDYNGGTRDSYRDVDDQEEEDGNYNDEGGDDDDDDYEDDDEEKLSKADRLSEGRSSRQSSNYYYNSDYDNTRQRALYYAAEVIPNEVTLEEAEKMAKDASYFHGRNGLARNWSIPSVPPTQCQKFKKIWNAIKERC